MNMKSFKLAFLFFFKYSQEYCNKRGTGPDACKYNFTFLIFLQVEFVFLHLITLMQYLQKYQIYIMV